MRVRPIFLLAAFLPLAASAAAQQLTPAPAAPVPARVAPQTMSQVQLSFAPVVARAAPAVVNVYARTVSGGSGRRPSSGMEGLFGSQRERVEQSLGSGVIVRPEGVIVTNNHVIAGANDIKVALADRREFSARVILADPRTDIAVLRIDTRGERLPALAFGNSDRAQVGDIVLAIGDPFGVGQTVTSGIVSALARTRGGVNDYQFFIQTDAAINPGDSGGALITLDGKIVGINTWIISPSGVGNIGIGFAVPANVARQVVDGALGSGSVQRPWLGAQGEGVTADQASGLGLRRPQGVLIARVYPGSPAANAGIVKGDVILSVDGSAVNDPAALNYRLSSHRAGEMAQLGVFRSGQTITVAVRVSPAQRARDAAIVSGRNPMQGATVATLSPALAEELDLDPSARGVVVTQVEPRSVADRTGFKPGDLVRQVNGMNINTVAQLVEALDSEQGWSMAVQRGNDILRLAR